MEDGTHRRLTYLAHLVGIVLVVIGCVVPGREVGIAGGTALISGATAATTLLRRKAETKNEEAA